jgi:hypothetical protein
MEMYLCGSEHCPKVLTTREGVEIGEEENVVKLKPAEWNVLVDSIKEGKLSKISNDNLNNNEKLLK